MESCLEGPIEWGGGIGGGDGVGSGGGDSYI